MKSIEIKLSDERQSEHHLKLEHEDGASSLTEFKGLQTLSRQMPLTFPSGPRHVESAAREESSPYLISSRNVKSLDNLHPLTSQDPNDRPTANSTVNFRIDIALQCGHSKYVVVQHVASRGYILLDFEPS